MKILIGSDGYTAHYYIRMGLGKAFTAVGHEVIMWQMNQKPVNDAFDEFEPDLFIGQTFNFKPSIINAIKERPNMKVVCKAGDWGTMSKQIDRERFQMLFASEEEIANTIKLKTECGKPDYVYIHYPAEYVEQSHGYWTQNGVQAYSQLLAADVFTYTNGQFNPDFQSDITFIGGYWPYKAQVLDPYLLPLCKKYQVKIFGNGIWPVHQYCGMLDDSLTKHALASATICPSLAEPHAHEFGFEISERPYKLASNKCFIISDWIDGLVKLYPEDQIVYAKSPGEFHYKVKYYIDHPDERLPFVEKAFKNTIENHTYFDRAEEMFTRLNLPQEATNMKHAKSYVLNKLGLL